MPFDASKIERAVYRALADSYGDRYDAAHNLDDANKVANLVTFRIAGRQVNVEKIQDLVEEELMAAGHYDAARAYILYRAEHAAQRDARPIPEDVRAAFEADKQYFPTQLQQWQYLDKYARYNRNLGRRETWVETVDRTVSFLHELAGDRLDREVYDRIRLGILNMEVMPSMRLLAMAGAPARRDNTTIYNCSYQAVDSLEAFSEALLISMAGCGVGFSVERKFVDRLPTVKVQDGDSHYPLHVVEDSAEGWAQALNFGLQSWFSGVDITFDYSMIRPQGSVLITKGGRASGPEPLRRMLDFVRKTILARQGQKLRPIDCHDIMCEVGNAAVSGGVRRTAMISLFDEDDHEMLTAKAPGFDVHHNRRWNANNSMVWGNVATMSQSVFIDRFMQMVNSGNGEPGIFSRENARALMPSRRNKDHEFGTNPCGEIVLRPNQFCNLSAAIVRAEDNFASLARKVELATIIGTIQSMATHFPNLRPIWKQNCEEERLLGVDITGQQDNPTLLGDYVEIGYSVFHALKDHALYTNYDTAKLLGINPSTSITCVKPSGNTSTLVNCSSGLHARWAKYQIKRVRVAATSPIYKVLRDAGVPLSPENGQTAEDAVTWVASFPVKAPEGAVTKDDLSAVQQCEWWLRNKLYWTEHNPSVTITYRPDEVIDLMQWVWHNRDKIGGMAFLPSFDIQLDQLPNEAITEAEYQDLVDTFPKEIDWARIFRYEAEDMSKASQTGACEGPICILGEE